MVDDLLQVLERDYHIQGRKFLIELRAHLRQLRAYFALSRALSVTSERLRDYIAYRQAEGAAPATINRELAALRRAFTLAVQSGLLAVAPKFPSLPKHNTRQGFSSAMSLRQWLCIFRHTCRTWLALAI
jgi:site-specific recombinase XerD